MNINQQVKPFMLMYRYDYFFHYLLINNEPLRLFLCQYISHDDSISHTTIENSETYKPSYDGKKLILDVVVKDDKGRYYNFEMQNHSIRRGRSNQVYEIWRKTNRYTGKEGNQAAKYQRGLSADYLYREGDRRVKEI